MNNIEIIDFFVQDQVTLLQSEIKFSPINILVAKILSHSFPKKEGKVNKIFDQKDRYISNAIVIKITPQYSVNYLLKLKNGCNTHPHNFYIQLLAETGLIGFIFILGLFFYLLLQIIKNIFFKSFKDSEICILIGFFVVLWPLTTNGNFFNNWINSNKFLSTGFFFIHAKYKKKKKGKIILFKNSLYLKTLN